MSGMEAVIDLPTGWINADKFELALQTGLKLTRRRLTKVTIRIPVGCKFLIEVILRLLSLCNQLVHAAIGVRLHFAGGQGDTMGYLDRIGFFEHLSPDVESDPVRPALCASKIHRGNNGGLVEIGSFKADSRPDAEFIKKFETAASRVCKRREDSKALGSAIFYMFGELIGNVCEHSESKLEAFAALQTYPNGNQLSLAVSDSGLGLLKSLRPGLLARNAPEAAMDDFDLILTAFRDGVSRLDEDRRGGGLSNCASFAVKYRGVLDVRLGDQRTILRPGPQRYLPSKATWNDGLAQLDGTHFGFTLSLT